MKLNKDIQGPQMMNPDYLFDPLTFLVALPAGSSFCLKPCNAKLRVLPILQGGVDKLHYRSAVTRSLTSKISQH